MPACVYRYFAWAKSDARIAGFNPWHFDYRASDQAQASDDMKIGAVQMPLVPTLLQHTRRKNDPESGQTSVARSQVLSKLKEIGLQVHIQSAFFRDNLIVCPGDGHHF